MGRCSPAMKEKHHPPLSSPLELKTSQGGWSRRPGLHSCPGDTFICWGCQHFVLFSRSGMSNSFVTPWIVAHQAPLPMGFPSKNAGVGCLSCSRGSSLAWGSNPGLLHCRWVLYHLSYQGSPRFNAYVNYIHCAIWLNYWCWTGSVLGIKMSHCLPQDANGT